MHLCKIRFEGFRVMKPVIRHILANGKEVKRIAGHKIPQTNPVYEIIFKGVKK